MFNPSSLIRLDKEFIQSVAALREQLSAPDCLPIAVNGLGEGSRDAYLVEALTELMRQAHPALVLVGSDDERERIVDLLRDSGINALAYKERELVFHNISASHDLDRERLSVLSAIAEGRAECVVATPAGAMLATVSPSLLADSSLSFGVGDELEPGELCQRLSSLGFSSAEAVEGAGQFSARGGIVDFWGADENGPIRVEFFGDEVDRMVYFDPVSQRAVAPCERAQILPSREVVVGEGARRRIVKEIDSLLKRADLSEQIRDRLQRERAAAASDLPLPFADKYLGLIYEEFSSLLDYFGRDSLTFVLGTAECRENALTRVKKYDSEAEGMISHGAISQRCAKYISPISRLDTLFRSRPTAHINSFAGGVGGMKLAGLFGFRARATVGYGGNPRMLYEDLRLLLNGGYRAVLLSDNEHGRDSLMQALVEEGFAPRLLGEQIGAEGGAVYLGVGRFQGFELIGPKVSLLSMSEPLGREVMANRRRTRLLRKNSSNRQALLSYAELTVGDYVVHATCGIGLFEGLQSVTVDGVTKDYITIKYEGTDKLLVPADRLEAVGKYIGPRDKDGGVKLSKMGGADWNRAKSRAKGAAKDIAAKLIALYAERQRTPGFAFSPDGEMEQEFASSFEYPETESQLQAIADISRDMIKPVPMNRLLCGDVGFGKTEVALRAAFKAIVCGKQVAMLVPTTILALQHFQTALSRMRGYAVNIEMLSRFKKPKERELILKRVKRGEVDLLIGTHSIISKKVEFADLGLLIIDEEQRFGVAQKERLRELRKNVDTLMLSATPIPRTLNMAMSGISDISVLDEAPGERLPVQTFVLEMDESVISDAIERELARGGQVLYLTSRIENTDRIALKLEELCRGARVAYAHGRMEKDELEDVWQMLVHREIDVLVCTTIIETGVDLPLANTLIIEDADRFGLSQLHQIRGRVGRSSRQAYAYLTYRPGKLLSEIAEKRLKTIKDFATFGSGFKIALRDMEIRGAGNLLGAEQHGYIESVGYGMYVKLLNEAIIEQRGESAKPSFESTVRINMTAHIPESYIASSTARMEMYKKISHIETVADRETVIDEFIDRFGEVPKVTLRLVNVALIKALAEQARISKVEYAGGRVNFYQGKPDLAIWSEVFAKIGGMSMLGRTEPIITARLPSGADPAELGMKILLLYRENMKEEEADE